eukprot:COSAG01_NODE_4822_length_4716_cov_4.892354_3_plen_112_part_00
MVAPANVDLFDLDGTFSAISWIHRDYRAYSVGQKVVDPRTGEILKGHVRLGSLRGRHDVLLGLGLLAGQAGKSQEVHAAVLARHRQLGAHEVRCAYTTGAGGDNGIDHNRT